MNVKPSHAGTLTSSANQVTKEDQRPGADGGAIHVLRDDAASFDKRTVPSVTGKPDSQPDAHVRAKRVGVVAFVDGERAKCTRQRVHANAGNQVRDYSLRGWARKGNGRNGCCKIVEHSTERRVLHFNAFRQRCAQEIDLRLQAKLRCVYPADVRKDPCLEASGRSLNGWVSGVEPKRADPAYPDLQHITVDVAWSNARKKGAMHLEAYRITPR